MKIKMRSSSSSYRFFLLLIWSLSYAATSTLEERQTYIIHMDHTQKPTTFSTHESWHRSTLASLTSTEETLVDEETFLYSYNHVMHGFSARLTPSQLSELQKMSSHVATYPESKGKLFTTYTPQFLGLQSSSGVWSASSYGNGVIIGILDVGIWPESKSFNDQGMPPVPERWKGECENGTAFSSSLCNRKLIGARSFNKGFLATGRNVSIADYDSARGVGGHGTHTASTAAGSYVSGAGYFGYANGTAQGVAPGAHIAMYKVCWDFDTLETLATDTLAGMDQAIVDGVDIMSLSFGFDQTPFYNDVIAIAGLSAIEKGIFISCATGNDGSLNSTHNSAPWIMTVGASTTDRYFSGSVTLGNGITLEGTSYFPGSLNVTDVPFYYGKGEIDKAECAPSALDPSEVAGKVVLCNFSNKTNVVSQFSEVNRTRAEAGIFLSDSLFINRRKFYMPSLVLHTGAASNFVREYAMGTANPTVKEMKFKITRVGMKPAPQVASFSSRGPDPIIPSILKPDILAPGVDVLAAWVPNIPYMQKGSDYLFTDYALLSGTSMSAPHVAGVAALLKSIHKDWSPAAIRSAIMTTAQLNDNTNSTIKDELTGLPATPLEYGAGHIDPNKAMDPGLVYDIDFQGYVQFLCGIGYSYTQMSAVLRRTQWSCNEMSTDLNYPSFMAIFDNSTNFPKVKNFSRTVTNVGGDVAAYRVVVDVPMGMRIRTEPNYLTFNSRYQKQGFTVSVEIDREAWSESYVAYGHIKWVDQQNHIVSSPVVAISR